MNENLSVEVTVQDSKDKHTYVRCHICNKDGQRVQIMASVQKHTQADIGGGNCIDFWKTSQILKCGGCETLFFRSVESNSEEVDYSYDHNGDTFATYSEVEKLYPEVSAERDLIKDFHLLPERLRAIYTEAAKALHSNQPVLAGIGIRAILETICKDKEAPGENLFQKIDGLKSQGVLSPNGALVLHKLRVLGNKSAHEVKPQNADQLSLAFDVLDNLLLNVYVLEPRVADVFEDE